MKNTNPTRNNGPGKLRSFFEGLWVPCFTIKLQALTNRVGWELHPFQRFMSSALILSYPPNFAESPHPAFIQKAVVILNTLILSLIYVVNNMFFGNFFSAIICSNEINIALIINFKDEKFWLILLFISMLFNKGI